jgi:hypothetical protein
VLFIDRGLGLVNPRSTGGGGGIPGRMALAQPVGVSHAGDELEPLVALRGRLAGAWARDPVDADGRAPSDHDAVVADFRLEAP